MESFTPICSWCTVDFECNENVRRFSAKLPTTKEQEKVKLLRLELKGAVSQTCYYQTYRKETSLTTIELV